VDSSPIQGFIGIDVPYAGQKMLVQKQGLDLTASGVHPLRELQGGNFQRLGAQPGKNGQLTAHPLFPEDAAKLPGIDEAKLMGVILERKNDMGMFFQRRKSLDYSQSPRHAEMDE
jgi:hypothetical protein